MEIKYSIDSSTKKEFRSDLRLKEATDDYWKKFLQFLKTSDSRFIENLIRGRL